LAVTSELAPTAKRGKYVAFLVFSIIPFCPSVLWAQLIASHSSWVSNSIHVHERLLTR
jgi:hypothetical protein